MSALALDGYPQGSGGSLSLTREFPIKNYGAVQDGVTDDSAAIIAAVAAAALVGGTVTYYGIVGWKGTITIPTEVGFVGPEASKTAKNYLKRLDNTAVLAFGGVGAGSGTQGPACGNFTIDMNGQNGTGLKIGRRVETDFEPICVINSSTNVGDSSPAVLIQEAQNNPALLFSIYDCAGPGLAIDLGAGNINFSGTSEINNCGSAGTPQLVIEQTGAQTSGVYPVPSQISFFGMTVERPASGATCNISVTAGSDILFDFCVSASSLGAGVAFAHISQQPDGTPHTNSRLRIRDCRFQNNTASAGTIFDIGTGCSLLLEGRNVVQTAKYLWKLAATAAVTKLGPFALLWANVDTELDPASAGTVEVNVLGSQAQVFTANGTWTVPAGVKFVEVTCVGGGGQGGGGGSALTSGGISNEPGGAGGGAGASSTQLCEVAPGTVLTVTVGAGGSAAGGGGASNSHAGTGGSSGSDTTVTGSGVSVTGAGGGGGAASGANVTTTAPGGGWGTAHQTSFPSNSSVDGPGRGGFTSSGRGETGGPPGDYSGGGGAGAAPATATNGGGGGSAGGGLGANAGTPTVGGAGSTVAGASSTSSGVNGIAAAANTGAGGGGGGGGAPGGAGGNGGAGGSGFAIIKAVA